MKITKILVNLSYAATVPFIFLSTLSLAQTGNPALDAELKRVGELENDVSKNPSLEHRPAQEKYQRLYNQCELGNQPACVEMHNQERVLYEELLEQWEQDTTDQ